MGQYSMQIRGVNGSLLDAIQQAKEGTINREGAVFTHMLNKAVEWGWLPVNRVSFRELPENNRRTEYLSVSQIADLQAAAEEDQNPHISLFISVGLGTAMRLSEIVSIRVEEIHFDTKSINVPKAKAGARVQPMTNSLAVLLEKLVARLPGSQVWLFPSEKSLSGHMTCPQKAFRRVVKKAGMDPSKILRHTLRHTAISHLVQAGVDLPTVMEFSGHKTLSMVQRYAHQDHQHIRDSLAKLDEKYTVKESEYYYTVSTQSERGGISGQV